MRGAVGGGGAVGEDLGAEEEIAGAEFAFDLVAGHDLEPTGGHDVHAADGFAFAGQELIGEQALHLAALGDHRAQRIIEPLAHRAHGDAGERLEAIGQDFQILHHPRVVADGVLEARVGTGIPGGHRNGHGN